MPLKLLSDVYDYSTQFYYNNNMNFLLFSYSYQLDGIGIRRWIILAIFNAKQLEMSFQLCVVLFCTKIVSLILKRPNYVLVID